MDDYPFGITSDDAVFAEYEVTGTVLRALKISYAGVLTFPMTARIKKRS
jgi:hypothetical protein